MTSPILPNVTAKQYAADRDAIRQIDSMPRIVQIGPFKFKATATDWSTVLEAEAAASKLAVILNSRRHDFGNKSVNDVLDELGEQIRGALGVDDSRPYGFTFTAEPL